MSLNNEVDSVMNILNQENIHIPKIGINLDLEPVERYQSVIVHFNIPKIRQKFQQLYKSYAPSFPGFESLSSFVTYLNRCRMMYFDELQYWSTLLEVPFHHIVMMQLLYEINSGCTTFIKEIEGQKVMVRTFDWPELFLKEVLYHGTFYKNGKAIYEGICILGGVGLFTGKSLTKDYCIAINYRRVSQLSLSSILYNFCNILRLYWPVSYLLREMLEKEVEYSTAVYRLSNDYLVSPVYYSICGFGQDPLIIQRGVNDYKHITGEFTIQTNCDNENLEQNLNIEYSIQRWKIVRKILEDKKSFKDIIQAIYTFPIIRDDTLFISFITREKFETSIL